VTNAIRALLYQAKRLVSVLEILRLVFASPAKKKNTLMAKNVHLVKELSPMTSLVAQYAIPLIACRHALLTKLLVVQLVFPVSEL
jgi:hypothetical protein